MAKRAVGNFVNTEIVLLWDVFLVKVIITCINALGEPYLCSFFVNSFYQLRLEFQGIPLILISFNFLLSHVVYEKNYSLFNRSCPVFNFDVTCFAFLPYFFLCCEC